MKFAGSWISALLILLGALGGAGGARAEDGDYVLVIRNHMFTPSRLELPRGKKIRLLVKNQDATPEEFESHSLNREKIILPGRDGVVYIGPLGPGTYDFFGDFYPKTAQGLIIVR